MALRGFGAAASLLLLSGLAAAQEPADRRPLPVVSEKLEVREVELLVGLPPALARKVKKEGALRREQVVVLEDGLPSLVLRAAPIAAAVEILVYVDPTQADPSSVALAGTSLAQRATALTGLGTVEIVVAGPDPKVVLESTREPQRVDQALADLAAAARRQEGWSGVRSPLTAASPDLRQIRRQLDRLVTLLADRRHSPGPKILLLVSDGFDLPVPDGLAAVAEAAQTIAAYGWVTAPVSLRNVEVKPLPRRQSDLEKFQEIGRGGKPRFYINLMDVFKAPENPTLRSDGLFYDAYALPRLAPLRALADSTSGTLLVHPEQLDTELDGLAQRWRLWYSSAAPFDGRVRRLQVRLAGGEDLLRGPRWIRTSTPESVAEARLRAMLAGSAERGTLPVRLTIHRQPGKLAGEGEERLTVEISLARRELPDAAAFGPLRVSLAVAGAAIRHEWVAEPVLTASGWSYTVKLPAAAPGGAAAGAAIAVEDLAHELWGGALIELASGSR